MKLDFVPAALAIALAAPASSAQRPATNVCTGRWTAPVAIRHADDLRVYVERGVITPLGNATLAVGSPALFWLGKEHLAPPAAMSDTAKLMWAVTRAGASIDSAGVATAVPNPDSLRSRDHPALIGWDRNRATIAWETADSGSRGMPNTNMTRIDVASFDGTRWTTPQTIITGQHLELSSAPAIRAGTPFELSVIAASGRDSASRHYLRLARRSGGRWTTVEWRGMASLVQAVALPVSDGSVLVAMLGAGPGGDAGLYTTRATWSADTVAWTPPVRVEAIVGSYSTFSMALLGGDSILIVRHQHSAPRVRSGLRTFITADGGRHWSDSTSDRALTSLQDERLAVTSDGRVHLVYRGTANDAVLNAPGAVMHSMLDNGSWAKPAVISADESVTGPDVGPTPNGGLRALWTRMIEQPDGSMPWSMTSSWVPGCAIR
jgi:hypothetical protein